MSNCNRILKEQGKAYPRTCIKCGWGPCRDKQEETIKDIEDSIKEITQSFIGKLLIPTNIEQMRNYLSDVLTQFYHFNDSPKDLKFDIIVENDSITIKPANLRDYLYMNGLINTYQYQKLSTELREIVIENIKYAYDEFDIIQANTIVIIP